VFLRVCFKVSFFQLVNKITDADENLKWLDAWLSAFNINFGVRQGSLLSPFCSQFTRKKILVICVME